MMKNICLLVFLSFQLVSCNASRAQKEDAVSKLEGSWELNYIAGSRVAFDTLYPNKKPTINFDLKENNVAGNNSCNSYAGKLNVTGSKIDFKQPMVVTKKMCIDMYSEQLFMNTLQKITSYSVTENGNTLNFISGDLAMMRFTKM